MKGTLLCSTGTRTTRTASTEFLSCDGARLTLATLPVPSLLLLLHMDPTRYVRGGGKSPGFALDYPDRSRHSLQAYFTFRYEGKVILSDPEGDHCKRGNYLEITVYSAQSKPSWCNAPKQ